MARFSRRRRTARRKKRAYRRKKQSIYRQRMTAGLPAVLKTKMFYRDVSILLTPTVSGYKRFVLNGLYDTDIAIGTVQPPLFDNYMALYTRYRVYKAKVDITFISKSYSCDVALIYRGAATADISNSLTYNWNAENPSRRSNTIRLADSAAYNNIFGRITKTFNLAKLETDVMTSVNYQGSSGTNPASLLYLDWVVAAVDGVNNPSVAARVDITYWMQYEHPISTEIMAND